MQAVTRNHDPVIPHTSTYAPLKMVKCTRPTLILATALGAVISAVVLHQLGVFGNMMASRSLENPPADWNATNITSNLTSGYYSTLQGQTLPTSENPPHWIAGIAVMVAIL